MIGQRISEPREENDYLIRQLAAMPDIDTVQLSKMERGERFFRKEGIIEDGPFHAEMERTPG